MSHPIIVFGNFRGGTTLTAKIVNDLGYCPGASYGYNLEDHAAQHLNGPQLISYLSKRQEEIKPLIKFPLYRKHYATIEKHFPNRFKYLCPIRDPWAIATSEQLRNNSDFNQSLLNAQKVNNHLIRLPDNVHKFSFENLLTRPHQELKAILRFINIEPDTKTIQNLVRLIKKPPYDETY